jgi:hypothetical protein
MRPGLGVMLFMLGGGSKHSSDEYVGKVVENAYIDDNHLYIDFEDGVKIRIYDDGQSCCEYRHMTCDDNPEDLVGGAWVSAQTQNGPDEEGEYGDMHEQQFLIVKTTKGTITIANHNEHNGYYGGFGLTIEDYNDSVEN